MKREYKHLACSFDNLGRLMAEINQHSAEGWRVISSNATADSEGNSYHYFVVERTEEEAREAKYLAGIAQKDLFSEAKP